jgi:hypothetical protein
MASTQPRNTDATTATAAAAYADRVIPEVRVELVKLAIGY